MTDIEELQNRVIEFVEEALENEKLQNKKIVVTGKSDKGEGYLGDIVFVTVTGSRQSNEETEIYLVLKMGKQNKLMREKFSVRDVYIREIVVYEKIFPKFREFQHERGAREIFNCVPKCYKTIVQENMEVVVFENLKKRGFELHDRQIPMNDAHIKFVLNKYAQFHAVSFAMRDLDKAAFDKLTENYDGIFSKMLLSEEMKVYYVMRFDKMRELIHEEDEELEKVFCRVFEKGLFEIMKEIFNSDVQECVITHGDCWNNNFMFKYENDDNTTPTDIAILDWQISSLHSPVIDLSYFLYIVSGEEQFAQLDEFLRFYHSKLSEYIAELGSDPEKMFPFSTLLDHWDKYSGFGITFLINSLELMLCDKDEAINIDDFADITDTQEAIDAFSARARPKNQSGYKARAFAAVRHHCEYFKNNIR